MTNHPPRTVTRHCDVAIVGGSAAGLAAGLQLGRQRRSVIVIDAGHPRNAPAVHMHSYLGYDGQPPTELTATGREEVRRYGGEVLPGTVLAVSRDESDPAAPFVLDLTGGHRIVARRVLAATGLIDELPEIEGLAEHWGGDVIHCPYCHGYEVRDQRIVQIVTHPHGLTTARLFRQLSERLTLVLHDGVTADDPAVVALAAAGATVAAGPAVRVRTGSDGRVGAVELADGSTVAADVIAVASRFRVNAAPFAALGLTTAPHPSGFGDHVPTDATGATAVAGLYAAGNLANPMHQVLQAAAEGSFVGAAISASLAEDDVRAAARPVANAIDWEQRYGDQGQMWSGNPNGTLVAEVAALSPGTVLDVGAGEGGDAIWLAEQGWRVTATDISTAALERVGAEAARRGLAIECVAADANAVAPFGGRTFDLVTAHYASVPRTPDGRAIANLCGAVAPGGTLLVVGHDLAPMRTPVDTDQHTRMFDPDAYVRVADVAAALAETDGWQIEVHSTRPRPPGAASSHHVDDEVLRARRHP